MGECELKIQNNSNKFIPTRFIITEHGTSVMGLDGLRNLDVSISLIVNTNPENNHFSSLPMDIGEMIKICCNCSGRMKIDPVELEYVPYPKFFKARSLAFGIRDPIKMQIDELIQSRTISPVQSSN